MSHEPMAMARSSQAGAWVLVVGPSGAGKDTLLGLANRAVVDRPRISFARRIVTRPRNEFEDHASVDAEEFEALRSDGAFALHWQAHGLSYAIPAQCRAAVDRGGIVVCNVSRTVVAQARQQLGQVKTVMVTASPDVLAQRIAMRGREAFAGQRLARDLNGEVSPYVDLVIDNSGSPEQGAAPLIAFLRDLHEATAGGVAGSD